MTTSCHLNGRAAEAPVHSGAHMRAIHVALSILLPDNMALWTIIRGRGHHRQRCNFRGICFLLNGRISVVLYGPRSVFDTV